MSDFVNLFCSKLKLIKLRNEGKDIPEGTKEIETLEDYEGVIPTTIDTICTMHGCTRELPKSIIRIRFLEDYIGIIPDHIMYITNVCDYKSHIPNHVKTGIC